MDSKCKHCASSMKHFVWIFPFLFCLPLVDSLPRWAWPQDPTWKERFMCSLWIISYLLCLHSLQAWFSVAAGEEGSRHRSRLQTSFVVKVPFYTSLITPDCHLLCLDTHTMQGTLLFFNACYCYSILHSFYSWLDTMLYGLHLVLAAHSNLWGVCYSSPTLHFTGEETETQGG